MSQRIPNLIWLVTLLISVGVGIWLGFGLGQQHWNFFGVIFGWYFFFLGIGQLVLAWPSSGQLQTQWFAWQLSCIYPLALLAYAVCAYWAMRHVKDKHKALILLVVAAFVAVLVSIPAAIVTMSINQHTPFLDFLPSYASALVIHGILFIQLLFSAVLGWLISMALLRLIRTSQGLRKV